LKCFLFSAWAKSLTTTALGLKSTKQPTCTVDRRIFGWYEGAICNSSWAKMGHKHVHQSEGFPERISAAPFYKFFENDTKKNTLLHCLL
jgi:hypothetical protein